MKPRFLVLACLALVVLGLFLAVNGNVQRTEADARMEYSATPWGEVLGFESDDREDYEAAKDQKATGGLVATGGYLCLVAAVGCLFAAIVLARRGSRPQTPEALASVTARDSAGRMLRSDDPAGVRASPLS